MGRRRTFLGEILRIGVWILCYGKSISTAGVFELDGCVELRGVGRWTLAKDRSEDGKVDQSCVYLVVIKIQRLHTFRVC